MELPTPGPHWYVNVIRPVEVSGSVVTWRDLIADVEAFTDGTYHIADIPELVGARESLPAEVYRACAPGGHRDRGRREGRAPALPPGRP